MDQKRLVPVLPFEDSDNLEQFLHDMDSSSLGQGTQD